MNFDGGVFMIIKPSTLHVFIFKGEAKWLNQVKGATSVRTQADDVACVGGGISGWTRTMLNIAENEM